MSKKVTNIIVILSLVLVLVIGLVVALVLSNTSKERIIKEGNFEFGVKGDVVSIKKFDNVDNVTKVTLPKEIQGYTVNTIGEGAFKDDAHIKEIELGENITTIGAHAFEGCKSLGSVKMKSVVTIGDAAFKGAESLSQVDMPESLVSIGDEAFMGCIVFREFSYLWNDDFTPKTRLESVGKDAFKDSRLYNILIPSSMKSIGERAFADASLYRIIFYEGVESIGREAFSYIDNGGYSMNIYTFNSEKAKSEIPMMSNIGLVIDQNKLPSSLKTIGDGAFKKSPESKNSAHLNIGTIEFGEGVESIGDEAFMGASIYNVLFKNDDITLGAYSFSRLYAQLEFTFPKNLKVIPDGLFLDTDMRRGATLHIPASVTSLGKAAFSGSRTNYTISFDEGSPLVAQYKFVKGEGYNALVSADGKVLYSMIMSSGETNFNVPAGVEIIEEYAFMNVGTEDKDKPNIEMDIPSTVSEIKANAFTDSGITSIKFMHAGAKPIKVDAHAFDNLATSNTYLLRAPRDTEFMKSLEATFKDSKIVEVSII